MLSRKILQQKSLRILVTRTDRIGDVIITTPTLQAIKEHFPDCFLSIMVSSMNSDLVQGNPFIDEVIAYDKKRAQRHWWQSMLFSFILRKKKFDIAIHFHPSNRVHIVSFLAGIPVRIGYERKCSYLLTHRIPELKRRGEKHEAEYNFDLLSFLDIRMPRELSLYFPLNDSDRRSFDRMLEREHTVIPPRSFMINPGASCPSRIWPAEKFATIADTLIRRFGLTLVLSGDDATTDISRSIRAQIKEHVIDLTGKLTLKMLGVLCTRVQFLISNDTGPAHIAAALGLPVVSLFARSDKGLSPTRWRPLGKNSFFIHKPEMCVPCRAHDCQNGFACLHNIQVDDVLKLLYDNKNCFKLFEEKER